MQNVKFPYAGSETTGLGSDNSVVVSKSNGILGYIFGTGVCRTTVMKRAMEFWLLWLGKWEETVVNTVLKTAPYCSASMRTITGVNPRFFGIFIKNKTFSLARRAQQPGVCKPNLTTLGMYQPEQRVWLPCIGFYSFFQMLGYISVSSSRNILFCIDNLIFGKSRRNYVSVGY